MERLDHLNLFHHYTQQGETTQPYENNLSRVLAIALDECPALFLMFLNLLNNKLKDPIPYPEDGYEIYFQKNTKDDCFDSVDKVYGFTLTTENNDGIKSKNDIKDKNEISDISIVINGIAILIEVKRNSCDAENQLNQQMNTMIKAFEKHRITKISPATINWTDVIQLLQNYKMIFKNAENRIVDDYLSELKRVHSEWFPELPFAKIPSHEVKQIQNRLQSLLGNYATKNNYSMKDNDAIVVNFDWCERIAFWYDENNKCIGFGVWAFDTSTQYWRHKNRKFILQNSCKVKINNIDVDLQFERYIKIAGWHYNKRAGANLNDCTDESIFNYIEKNIGRWSSPEFEKLKQDVKNDKFLDAENYNSLISEFKTNFVNANRPKADLSVGCYIGGKIDYKKMQQYDDDKDTTKIYNIFESIIEMYNNLAK